MSKVLTVTVEKCTGCGICELACSMVNTGEFNPSRSRVHIAAFLREFFYFPMVCSQCEKALCAQVCPVGAITRDSATGALSVSETKCIGCKTCTLACPFGSIEFSSIEHRAVKCELCNGDPECVKWCATKALEYRQPESATTEKRRLVSQKLKETYSELK